MRKLAYIVGSNIFKQIFSKLVILPYSEGIHIETRNISSRRIVPQGNFAYKFKPSNQKAILKKLVCNSFKLNRHFFQRKIREDDENQRP